MGSKLISIGCSYTDHNCFPNVKYWDVHLAEYLNLELHNYARGGGGGDMHLSMLTDAIAEHGDSIDTVAIGWSQWFRYSFPYLNGPERYNPPTVNTYEHEHQKTVWTWLALLYAAPRDNPTSSSTSASINVDVDVDSDANSDVECILNWLITGVRVLSLSF